VEANLTTGAPLAYVTATPSDTLYLFCRVYPAAARRLDELGAAGGGAPTPAPRRRPQASASHILDAAPSRHMAKTTKTRVYEDM